MSETLLELTEELSSNQKIVEGFWLIIINSITGYGLPPQTNLRINTESACGFVQQLLRTYDVPGIQVTEKMLASMLHYLPFPKEGLKKTIKYTVDKGHGVIGTENVFVYEIVKGPNGGISIKLEYTYSDIRDL